LENIHNFAIREIQHFVYCPRRFALMYFENIWVDSAKTINGDLVHEKVNDPFLREKRNGKVISRAVPLFSDTLNLHGVADYVEFINDDIGCKITVTEYKATEPYTGFKINMSDTMQITAQVMCLEEMFGQKVFACVYYGNTRRKYSVEITESNRQTLHNLLKQMRELIVMNMIPNRCEEQVCKGCSFEAICLPKMKTVKNYEFRIEELIKK
jgi:CRISPR-associated exonuclease Cas4